MSYKLRKKIHHSSFIIHHSRLRRAGFTLMEIIVVVALLGLVGMMAVNIFFTSLRAGTKAELLKEIKQNGDFAISTMERMIRNAEDIEEVFPWVCDGSNRPNITIRNPDYGKTTFSCGNQIASISATPYSPLPLTPTPTPVTTYLTSSELFVGPYNSECYFTCRTSTSTPEAVTIYFVLHQSSGPIPARPEERASATFETTVSLRNY